MERDIRGTRLYRDAEDLAAKLWRPGRGEVGDAAEADASPDGERAVFTGTIVEDLSGAVSSRICSVDLATGEVSIIPSGGGVDRLPKHSPDGRVVAFLSDRHGAGDFQLYLLEVATGAVRSTPRVEGWVEYLHWSPDGRRILLGVAGHGADVAGAQGAITSRRAESEAPSWMPSVNTGDEAYGWRGG